MQSQRASRFFRRFAGVLTLSLALTACGGGGGQIATQPMAPSAPPRDEAALNAAVEAYYGATTPAAMRAAVAAALKAGPDAALAREVAADLAYMEDRPAEEIAHLLVGLRDPSGDAPRLLLHWLSALEWTSDQRAAVEATLQGLVAGHPDAEVQAFAAWMLAHDRHLRGDAEGRDSALAEVGFRPPMAIIGPWDNDQGKAFDVEHPPERGVDLGARYDGKFVELKWRADRYPLDPRGKIDFEAALHPSEWQVAYAAAAVELKAAGRYEVRLGTADALKVWVDGTPVFEGPRLSTWLFDGVVIPLDLPAGVHRILVKSGQAQGSWLLSTRITGPQGAALAPDAIRALPADAVTTLTLPKSAPLDEAGLVAARVAKLPEGSARRAFHTARWADDLGLRVAAVESAEAWLAANPQSLRARLRLAIALWDNQERGRTADLLNGLDEAHGLELPRIALHQARFWAQQRLNDKARARLVTLRDKAPDRPGAHGDLAALFEQEDWHEDSCAALAEVTRRWPNWPAARYKLGNCFESLRFYPKAEAEYRAVLEELPADAQALERLHAIRLGADDYDEAIRLARRLTVAWPHRGSSWRALAETLRRAGKPEAAADALRTLLANNPDHPDAYGRLARLALQEGKTPAAVELWREALVRDPENEGISNHLSFLAPEKAGPWAADIPDQAALDRAVAEREMAVKAAGNADTIYLLDDEVTALGADGSTNNVVTMVAHAVNQSGRDGLTSMSLRSGGRARVLQAYAVDPAGKRVEASSIRGRTVRFRQLSVGSTVVLQYRSDERPDGYLAGHMARQWWFQGPGTYTHRGRWVLWTAKGTPVLEEHLGDVAYTTEARADQVRHAWEAKGLAPLVGEPGMPTLGEVAAHVLMSTVPNWDMFWSWERELLRDAFRVNPEVEALAKRVLADANTPAEKVRRIQAYLMGHIRYQQDYEGRIAGVKPHAAPMVVERQYGDCKDKAVLFITLARLAGIEVHFALVRTRDAGPVRLAVPMQQFNHAIVYVPAQEGISEGRFYDPTVDALDIDVLRHDDQGTLSLVFDPKGNAHAWREIPYQDPSMDEVQTDGVLRLTADGGAEGEVALIARGRVGEYLRTGSRNVEQLGQQIEQQLGHAYNSARMDGLAVEQVEDLFVPARVRVKLKAPNLGRREENELRLRMPVGWTPQQYFGLAKRRYPLLLGAPRTLKWRNELVLPLGGRVKRLPADGKVETPCLVLERHTRHEGNKVISEQSAVMRCERIATQDYAAHRKVADEMQRLLDDELVLSVPPPTPVSTVSSADR